MTDMLNEFLPTKSSSWCFCNCCTAFLGNI